MTKRDGDRTLDLIEEIERGVLDRRPEAQTQPPHRISGTRVLDPRFDDIPRHGADRPPKPSKQEDAAAREARLAKSRQTPDGHFCCSACGGEVVRPPEVSASAWAQRRRCDACVAANRQPPEGMRHCRKCGKLYKLRGCERFCRPHLPP